MKMKKTVATMMAILTMATSAVGLSANAAVNPPVPPVEPTAGVTVSHRFGTGNSGTATCYRDNTKANASTNSSNTSTTSIKVQFTGWSGDDLTGVKSKTLLNQTSVSLSCRAANRTLASVTSKHTYVAGGSNTHTIVN